ncbi:MarR family transcriptional regulator [Thiothrix litoralis]|uniref:MarR family transcriptional regulator n=1 Tax=Thiothrix litoralis TaxID=2891210 RepID=A0ABX7WUY3_9GAMM|nr:MarR family transcriptional regulator [Thiothrix litoralis]QTR46832.1 MarR family transcriptional regulator [Thiothrix litoralis]
MEEVVLLDQVLIALRRILRATELHSKHLNKTVNLTFPQLLILKKLTNENRITTSQLADELSLSRATITSIVDRLENRGLVTRERSEDDRRVIFLMLSEAGASLLKNAPPSLQENFVQRLRKLEEWQKTMILSSLQQVATMMDVEKLEASPLLVNISAPDRNIPNELH